MKWSMNGASAASDLIELEILTIPSSVLQFDEDLAADLLHVFLLEDIKNNVTFEKFKSYTKQNMPNLFGLVNSMGKYQIKLSRFN